MISAKEIQNIVRELCIGIKQIFQDENIDVILFGSYAHGDADEESDIDVLLLLDAPRETIADRNWRIGELTAELLLTYGVVVAPLVENRAYFNSNLKLMPLYKNIMIEGVKIDI